MDRKTAVAWIFQALELKRGEKLFLPCGTKAETSKLLTLFRKELVILNEISSDSIDQLKVKPTFKDSKFWVILSKELSNGDIAFKKSKDGEVTKVLLNS